MSLPHHEGTQTADTGISLSSSILALPPEQVGLQGIWDPSSCYCQQEAPQAASGPEWEPGCSPPPTLLPQCLLTCKCEPVTPQLSILWWPQTIIHSKRSPIPCQSLLVLIRSLCSFTLISGHKNTPVFFQDYKPGHSHSRPCRLAVSPCHILWLLTFFFPPPRIWCASGQGSYLVHHGIPCTVLCTQWASNSKMLNEWMTGNTAPRAMIQEHWWNRQVSGKPLSPFRTLWSSTNSFRMILSDIDLHWVY